MAIKQRSSFVFVLLGLCILGGGGSATSAQAEVAPARVEHELTEQIRSVLRDGGDPNARTRFGRTLLWTAAMLGLRDEVGSLLDRGADPNRCADKCAVHFAAIDEDTTILRLLVSHCADVNRATEKYSYTALILASDEFPRRKRGHSKPTPGALESVRILIAAGADVNHVDGHDRSALRIAMGTDNFDIARALLDAGADVHQRGNGQNSILMETITSYGMYKNPEGVRLLLAHGAEPNDRNDKSYLRGCEEAEGGGGCGWRGYSVLTYAARSGYYSVVKLLLEHGADPSLPREDGKTAAEIARAFKHPKTAGLIEEYLSKQQDPAE